MLSHCVRVRRDRQPCLIASTLFLTAFAILIGMLLPWRASYQVTVAQAAAPGASSSFIFQGIGMVALPVSLIDITTIRWIFRGKVSADRSYD
ncbi:cytochrome d ubiquinol oxidase subunit II [Thiocapsa roseopersicina]|uniref:Cytochrome d ubiquinol oxidase subunit II n=1 Tax=Thiocapsa roseopersicina TaxID=1058 RepID=A0A1H2WKB3_THIRO|nr:cytochrome d ubiquinol oxidase subunit II [Thiocapsa roseopersicina]